MVFLNGSFLNGYVRVSNCSHTTRITRGSDPIRPNRRSILPVGKGFLSTHRVCILVRSFLWRKSTRNMHIEPTDLVLFFAGLCYMHRETHVLRQRSHQVTFKLLGQVVMPLIFCNGTLGLQNENCSETVATLLRGEK